MLRKYPWLANLAALVVVGLYCGLLYYLIVNFLRPGAAPDGATESMLLGGSTARSQFSSQLFTTANAGQSWSELPLSNITTKATRNSSNVGGVSYNLFSSLTCPAVETCFATGLPGGIYATLDGGKHWTGQLEDSTMRVQKLSCPAEKTCYGLATNRQGEQILATSDGGQHWTTSSPGTSPGDLLDLTCPSSTNCFAVGKAGRILASHDGAKTFQLQEAGTERTLSAISCADASHCVAVGQVGTTVATSDGGSNWTKHTFGYARDLSGVSCPVPTTCFALGGTSASGNLVASFDGGISWKILDYGSGEGHTALACPSVQTCYATGQQGKIRVTSDGGTTWHQQSFSTTRPFQSISCPSAARCFALTSYYDPGSYDDYPDEDY